jgi:voltage-gated potassium channel
MALARRRSIRRAHLTAESKRSLKTRTHEILEKAAPGDTASQAFDIFIMTLICLNILATILETVRRLSAHHMGFFRTFEVFSVAVFTVEYVLRIWSCTSDPKFAHPVKGRLRFAVTPMALVDLMAVLPFYLPRLIPLDLRFIRALRLFRLFRVFKFGRYSEALDTLGHVIRAKREELIITVFFTAVSWSVKHSRIGSPAYQWPCGGVWLHSRRSVTATSVR